MSLITRCVLSFVFIAVTLALALSIAARSQASQESPQSHGRTTGVSIVVHMPCI